MHKEKMLNISRKNVDSEHMFKCSQTPNFSFSIFNLAIYLLIRTSANAAFYASVLLMS